jgi:hypothetical protein
MPSIESGAPRVRTDPAHDKATLDWSSHRRNVRITLVGGVACLTYAIFGGVIFAAYQEFGSELRLDLGPLVIADRAPLKLPPGEALQDRTALAGRAGTDAAAPDAGAHLAPPRRQSPHPNAAPDSGQTSEADALVLERPAMAPQGPEPAPAIAVLATEEPVAAAPERRATAPQDPAPAAAVAGRAT